MSPKNNDAAADPATDAPVGVAPHERRRMKRKSHRHIAQGIAGPVLLFVLGVVLAAWAAHFSYRQIDSKAKDDFERVVMRAEVEINARMENTVAALRGARGLYAAVGPHVSREAFRHFVLSRNLDVEFPGVRGFGFIQRVGSADLPAFIAAEQRDGAPDFAIRQLDNKRNTDLFVVKFIEPTSRNEGVLGLDIGSEAVRRAGIQQAVNTGAPTVTGVITLVQDGTKSPGLLLYVPVYKNGAPIDVAKERRAALVGVLYAPLVMSEILQGIRDAQAGILGFQITDAPINSTDGTVMYDTDPGAGVQASRTVQIPVPRYTMRMPLQLPGRSITIAFRSTPAFEANINAVFPWLILGGGTLISALLAILLRQQASGRIRAEQLANLMTRDLQIATRDNEAMLSTLNLHTILSVTDREGRLLDVNDAFCAASGYTRDELVGQRYSMLSSSVQPVEFWRDMWKVISSGLPYRGPVCNLSKDGNLYWLDTLIAPFIGSDGQIEKYISISTNITEAKKAEEALRWNQSLLDKMANSSPLAFLVVDNRTDDILYFNPRFCEIWNIEHLAERMRRRELKSGDLVPYCLPMLVDVPAFLASRALLLSENDRITQEVEIAFTEGRTIRRFSTQIRDADDRYFGRFFIFEDITTRKNEELALIQATQAAQAASLTKSQFLANMSHEIRTPMNAILGMLTLLRHTELTVRQADYATKSEGAARTLMNLLNEILDYSKIEAGKMELDPQPFAVDQLLRDLSTILSANVGDKPVELLFDIDPALPRRLVGDAMRLQQVLLNLGTNAIKFTEHGEAVLAIRVVQRTDDSVTLLFSVTDSGIGIAPENQSRIFSGFTQAEASTTRRYGGTGLGLAISQRFVALMGGAMELHSEPGKGSRFYFTITLPVLPSEVPPQRTLESSTEGTAWHVLVVDDSVVAREVLGHMGASLGWQVDLADSGAQALHWLEQRQAQGIRYQAVFVDWDMPGMDGWQTSEKLRALQAASHSAGDPGDAAIVVMVTAHGRDMLLQRSQGEQALLDGYLVKPLTASMLFDAVVDAHRSLNHTHPLHVVPQTVQRRLEGMRLLLVEDNLNNQQVARELLEGEGATVQIANNGQEAVDAVQRPDAGFDVVLMDWQMPVMDGFAATRIMRNELGLTTLPIVAMTANAMASDREACLAVGMNDHVGKPFDLTKLVDVLRTQAGWRDALAVAVGTAPIADRGVLVAAAAAGVDVHSALSRMGGKQDIYRRMLHTFVSDLPPLVAQLRATTEPDVVRRSLHTIKGLAATLGVGDLATAAASAEKSIMEMPLAASNVAAVANVSAVMERALPGLQALLAALAHEHAVANSDQGGGDRLPLDRTALQAALQALLQLLAAQDMDAMTALSDVQQHCADAPGDAMAADMAALEQAMAHLDFDAALRHTQALLAKYFG